MSSNSCIDNQSYWDLRGNNKKLEARLSHWGGWVTFELLVLETRGLHTLQQSFGHFLRSHTKQRTEVIEFSASMSPSLNPHALLLGFG